MTDAASFTMKLLRYLLLVTALLSASIATAQDTKPPVRVAVAGGKYVVMLAVIVGLVWVISRALKK